jgi:hypothetical protein
MVDNMAILKTTYQASNFNQNSITYEITVTSDTDITSTDIDTVLPNNGSKYGTLTGISFIPTGSSATIYCPNYMIITDFTAESGTINTTTNHQEGHWVILAKVTYKT